jgi:hypothetical protein
LMPFGVCAVYRWISDLVSAMMLTQAKVSEELAML